MRTVAQHNIFISSEYWSTSIFFLFQIIVLTVVALDLEGQLCLYDYITFYDGPTPESHRLLRLCDRSEIVTTVLTSGNQIYLDFFSDDQQQFTGFTLEYEFQDQDYGQGECSAVQIVDISISNLYLSLI